MHVGRRDVNDEWDAVRVGDQMAFAASFRPIRGVGPGVGPPKTARMLALSITPSDASIRPARPSRFSKRAWIFGQTPACIHSCRRRQQVTPLPQPNSRGTNRQGMPVRRTYTIPVRQARSGTRGRPPLGLGGSFGNSGSISFHNAVEPLLPLFRLLAMPGILIIGGPGGFETVS